MNDFFEMAKQYNDKAAQTVSNKSNEIVEKTKCRNSISSTEEQITKAYAEIGRYYYESHLSGELFEGFVADKCASIDEWKQKLDELNQSVQAAGAAIDEVNAQMENLDSLRQQAQSMKDDVSKAYNENKDMVDSLLHYASLGLESFKGLLAK